MAREPILLSVNDRDHRITAPADAMLLDVLRDELGLLGAKYGCGEGKCGACCVLIDGRSQPACIAPIADLRGHAIVTVEGLAAPSAVQDAFVEEAAMQCGYCTSGMVIAATALLSHDPAPSDDEIRGALERHLCRCGVYGRVVRAVRRASGAAGGAAGGAV